MKTLHVFVVGILVLRSLVFVATPTESYSLDLSQPLKVPSLVIPIRPTSDLDGMSLDDLKSLGFKFYQVSQPTKRRTRRAHSVRPSASIANPYRERAQARAWAGMLPAQPTFNSIAPTKVNPLLARVAALRAEAPVETESEVTLDETAILPVAHAGGNLSMEEFVRRGEIAATGAHVLMATCTPTSGSMSAIQTCITNAARGDTVSVPVAVNSASSGLTFPTKTGSFNGSNWITIQSANIGSLPSARVNNTTDAANMPTITVTGSGQAALSFNSGATGYKVIGLHLTNNLTISSSSDLTNNFVYIPSDASDLSFDRMVINPKENPTVATDYLGSAAYCFNVQGDRVTVDRSYLYQFFGRDGTDYKLKGVVAAEAITGISNASSAVITYDGSPAVASGDVVRVVLPGGGLTGAFEPGSGVANDFVATAIDGTHFSVPVNTSTTDVFDPVNTRAMFFRWPRVASVTLGNPTTITTAVAHNISGAGNKIRPRGFASTLGSAINGNDYTLTVTGATTFTIPVNTTGLSSYSGSGGYYKSESSSMQTIVFGVGADVQDLTVTNNFIQGWYAGMQTAGSDASPTVTTTVLSSPSPTASTIYVASTTGISVGMLIAVDTTHSDIAANCPFGGQGGDRPCFAFGKVSAVNSGTGQVDFSPTLKVKNGSGVLVDPFSAILSPGQVNVTGQNPTDINLYYNTVEIPFDYTAFHYAANGNTSKGVIEGKDCTDCIVEGNIIQGFPSSFSHTVANQNGSSPWMGLFNITIQNNWFKAFYVGSLNSFTDYNARNTQGHTLTVHNNLFLGGVGYVGECFRFSSPSANITYTHNTCANGYPAGATSTTFLASTPGSGHPYYSVNNATGVVIRDNLMDAGQYVAQCYEAGSSGVSFASACFSSPVLQYNGFAKTVASSDPLSIFTHATNKVAASWAAVQFVGSDPDVLTDWALAAGSPFKGQGSSGSDMGVNIATLAAALANNDGFTGGSAPPASPAKIRLGKTTKTGKSGEQ